MVVPIIAGLGIAARIAATIAKSPTARAGIKKAIEKFGKDAVKKHAGKIPSVVRSSKITKSAKQGRKYRAKSKAIEKEARSAKSGTPTLSKHPTSGRVEKGIQAARTRKKRIERLETPDRTTTLGKRGYNYQWMNKGGSVNSRSIAKKYFKGGLV